MEPNTRIKVRNRSAGSVGYTIPDLGSYPRHFAPKETKEIPFTELEKLSFLPGGECLLSEYLVIEDLEARRLLLGHVEMEYDYTQGDVRRLLTSGSLDEFLDCLDFAPLGVIDEIKQIAVEIELPDMRKRNAIQQKTGFNVTRAIEIMNLEKMDTGADQGADKQRRVSSTTTAASEDAPVRRYKMK